MPNIKELITRNRAGQAVGLPCFCTANEHVLRAVLSYAARTGFPTVIEATCNQVNQDGGYTQMNAADFMSWLHGMANESGVPKDRLILGGDHLGPNPWKAEPIGVALEKARELVKQYVQAGFTKIHLDASMACGGESNPSFEHIAERTADLCSVAETNAPDPENLFYIIGTEVPIPGGETEEPDALDVTSVVRFNETITTHRDAFSACGLDAAWERVYSVVTQPGADFGHSSVYPFVPEKAGPLSEAILGQNGLTFEAHSTDYQPNDALAALVEKHFFFLKVGPELTFRFREAVWALAGVEEQLGPKQPSRIREIITDRMTCHPEYWQEYYRGAPDQIAQLRTYSYSDRIRYYWTDPQVSAALEVMLQNLSALELQETVLSQAFMGLDFGDVSTDASELIENHIQRCVIRYFQAAGFHE